MEGGKAVQRYQFGAVFKGDVLEWRIALQTDDGKRHELTVRDGEEIPILLQICRTDSTIYYDAREQLLRTGWNTPGGAEMRA